MYEIVNVQYTGTYNNGGTSIPAVLGEFRASSAADLPAQNVDCHIICGCDGLDIATGDRYIWNGTAWILQPSDRAFSNVYTIPEIDSMINTIYQYMMYYHTAQESTDGTITFYTLGGNVGILTIYGNGQQNGTPSPDNIIMPDFCGEFDGTDWSIPITCGGQTTPVYLGQTPTVRKIVKKEILSDSIVGYEDRANFVVVKTRIVDLRTAENKLNYLCSHFKVRGTGVSFTAGVLNNSYNNYYNMEFGLPTTITSLDDAKAWFNSQKAAGTPVTVWYVVATPETAIVNEPLAKIGDYADELHLTKDDITIPTVSGENTLTIDTAITPSKIEISGER